MVKSEKLDIKRREGGSEEIKGKDEPFKAFLFDARYVPNRGVACLLKIMSGGHFDQNKLRFLRSYHTGNRYDVYEIGIV